MLPGKKSYIVMFAAWGFAAVGFSMGWIDGDTAAEIAFGGAGLGALRAAVGKVQS